MLRKIVPIASTKKIDGTRAWMLVPSIFLNRDAIDEASDPQLPLRSQGCASR